MRVFFSRGISIKKGIITAIYPILFYLIFLVLFGTLTSWILSLIIITIIQLKEYLKIQFSIVPSSLIFLMSLILSILIIGAIIALISYKSLKKQIPTALSRENQLHLEEDV